MESMMKQLEVKRPLGIRFFDTNTKQWWEYIEHIFINEQGDTLKITYKAKVKGVNE